MLGASVHRCCRHRGAQLFSQELLCASPYVLSMCGVYWLAFIAGMAEPAAFGVLMRKSDCITTLKRR